MQRVKTLCFSLAVRCPLLCPLLCSVWARQTKHWLTQRNVLLTVGHCSLSWGRHTNGGLSKVTLLLFSGPILFTCLSTLNGALCVPMHERWGGGGGGGLVGWWGVRSLNLLLWEDRLTTRPRRFRRSFLCCVHTEQTWRANSGFFSLRGFCCHFLTQGGRCPNSPTRSCAPTLNAAVSTARAAPLSFFPARIAAGMCSILSFCMSYSKTACVSNSYTCTDPILIARALQDYYPGDCRFIPIRQGQLIYVYAMLKDRGNLFWAGSVS